MAGKPSKSSANDDLDDLFEGITDETAVKKTVKSKAPVAKGKSGAAEQDILAALENELDEKPASRPHTPQVRQVTPVKRTSTDTPPPAAGPGAGADTRKSAESARSYHASFTPSATSSELQESERKAAAEQPQPTASSGGGGWWGGLLSTATAAIKQAEATVKEIQPNEEANKWADQVRGINVGALRGLGDELRHRALPTFTNVLHTLAPPISSHERLLIHIIHDLVGYPSLDPFIYGVFSRVMAQVEGGDLLVVSRPGIYSSQSWLRETIGVLLGRPIICRMARLSVGLVFSFVQILRRSIMPAAARLRSDTIEKRHKTPSMY